MKDSFGRTIDYLRVSVTDRCNFRCVYCMPENGYPVSPKDELLTFEEITRVVHIAADMGIRKVRLTGGEPLVRKDLPTLIRKLREHPGISDLSLTTNASLLSGAAPELAAAGLHRVNISLDTLRADRFLEIARRGDMAPVMDGIAVAQRTFSGPTKINCVLMRGVNDDEAVAFARWTLREPLHIRFIELMPIRWNLDETESYESMGALAGRKDVFNLRVSQDDGMLSDAKMRRMVIGYAEVKERIEQELGPLEPFDLPTNGPAHSYKLDGGLGSVGFISQISNDLCSRCNRIRLTADGQLRPCLMSDGELDVRGPMRSGASDEQLGELIKTVVIGKPERHYLADGQKVLGRGMSQIGG